MLQFFKKQKIIGVDISDYSIEILCLKKNKRILSFGRALLKEGVVHHGSVINKEGLSRAIKEAIRNSRPKSLAPGRRLAAIASLPQSKVFLYYFELPPNSPPEKIELLVAEEVSKIIPVEKQRVYWDYKIIPGNSSRDEARPLRILYAATPKTIADDYIRALKMADVETIVLDLEAESLGRALLEQPPETYGSESDFAALIIDIGAQATVASVFNKNRCLNFSYSIPYGGSHCTKSIAEKLKIPEQEAEALKKQKGFGATDANNLILPIIQIHFQKIIEELKRIIGYYENKTKEKIGRIILAGGSAQTPRADEYLSINLDRPVVIANPLNRLRENGWPNNEISPVIFSNVIGLALRATDNPEMGINLMPAKKGAGSRDAKIPGLTSFFVIKNNQRNKTIAAVFCAAAIVFFGLIIYQYLLMVYIFNKYRPPSSLQFTEVMPDRQKDSPKNSTSPQPETAGPGQEPQEETVDGTAAAKPVVLIIQTPTGWLRVREKPGTQYPEIAKVLPGEKYRLLEETAEWYKIELEDGRAGWISAQYASKS